MGFVKARGSSFYYEEQGKGQPILLIPPSGSTASTWGTLPGDLAGAGRVIAYDRRGYTRSAIPAAECAGDRRRRARRRVRRAGQVRPGHCRSDAFIGGAFRYLRFPPGELRLPGAR
jgi:pimeloyl-ACP methyl ester carboxylesterase